MELCKDKVASRTTCVITKLLIVTTFSYSLSLPSYAQTQLTETIKNQAQEACVTQAKSEGFDLDNVVTIEPDSEITDRVKVVLDLNRDQQAYKLTCYYDTASQNVLFEEEETTVARKISPWWWLLLPIVGIPLLLWLIRGGNATSRTVRTQTTRRAWIRSNGQNVQVHSGAGSTYQVNRTIADGQEVMLTGRYENDWAELEFGGWIPRQYLEIDSRYS